MRRFLVARFILAIALLMVAGTGWADCFPSFPSFGRWSDGCGAEWWNDSSLTFYAPFDNPADPLRLIKGTGTLSFTRATTATYVHPTTGLITSAASGQLRIESNGALIEGQRTNLCPNSEAFNTGWIAQEGISSVTPNDAVAPDGNTTAEKITLAAGTGPHQMYQGVGNGTDRCFSVFAKAGTASILGMGYGYEPVDNGAYFDLSNGTITVAGGYTAWISAVGNGWYRCSILIAPSSDYMSLTFFSTVGQAMAWNAAGTETLYLWGAQAEAGSFPSSYIPTTTAAVTRNADGLSATITGNVSQTLGTASATVVFKDTGLISGAHQGVLGLQGGTGYILYRYYQDGKAAMFDGTSVLRTAATMNDGSSHNIASRWSSGDSLMRIVIDGGTVASTNFDNTFGGSPSYLSIGDYSTFGASKTYGNIKNLRIWSRSMSDVELQNLTTP